MIDMSTTPFDDGEFEYVKTRKMKATAPPFIPGSADEKAPLCRMVSGFGSPPRGIPVVSLYEQKVNDVFGGIGVVPVGGINYSMNTLAQGVDIDERIGRKVIGEKLDIHLVIRRPLSDSSFDWVRIIVMYDQQPNGTVASLSDILDLGVVTAPYFAPHNRFVNADRFVCLLDHRFGYVVGTAYGAMADGPQHMTKSLKIPRRLKNATYGISGNAVPITGCISVHIVSLDNSGGNSSAQVGFSGRYYFKDG